MIAPSIVIVWGAGSDGLAIQAAVLDRFGDVLFMNGNAAIQVGNGAGNLEDAVEERTGDA